MSLELHWRYSLLHDYVVSFRWNV